MAKPEIAKYPCYLCGQTLDPSTTREHVIDRQFFPSKFRKTGKAKLFQLPAHMECNKSFQPDEDYFFMSLSPLAKNSAAGSLLWRDLAKRIKRKQNAGLTLLVRSEFSNTLPSGIILPSNKMLKKFDGKRIERVIWKITRGLFFKIYNQILSDNTPRYIRNIDPQQVQPENIQSIYNEVKNQIENGDHPGIFAFKYIKVPDVDNFHVWAMLFWDHLIFLVMFHDPKCSCVHCAG